MWGLESLGIAFNSADGTVVAPLWAVGIVAALVVLLFILALLRTGLAGTLVFLTVVGFGGWGVWSWMEHQRSVERRALEVRLSHLEAQPLGPNSALACLDGTGGETVEAACERGVFANPEATAAAVSYTAARLTLLADALDFAGRRDPGFDRALEGLRSGLEQDRFGFVAHVLALRKNCTADRCDALRVLREPARVRNNLRDNTFDGHLARAATGWPARTVTRATEAVPVPTAAAVSPGPARGTPLPPGYNLPSSASIPPVSIMTSEPSGPPAAEPAPHAGPPTPPRRPAAHRPPQRSQSNSANPPAAAPGTVRVQ